jgi:Raf kinase inhibitor-like YbhB/YbcL family protein
MLLITSPAFSDGGPIPRAHTCDGANLSPPLTWTGVPDDARSLALIMDDPDAPGGTFVHWVLYGLPGATQGLPSGVPTEKELKKPVTAKQGGNDFHKAGYGGPCPPPGPAHRYMFKLYALREALDLPVGATKEVLVKAMEGKILAEAVLTGMYARK